MKFRLLVILSTLSWLLVSSQAEAQQGNFDEPSPRLRGKQTRERDVRKAASRKKKELRDMGVKNVRVKNPGDWPRRIAVPEDFVLTESSLPEGKAGAVYESNHFCYIAPTRLDASAQKTLSRLCECAYAANRAIGAVLPVPRATAERGDKKFLVVLHPTMEAYLNAGGPEGSAGVFMGHRLDKPGPIKEADIVMDQVMIPFTSLGLNSSGAVQREDIDTHALVHELTHQQFMLNGLPIWANEGWAEYVGYVPYVGEELDFDRGFSLILHTAKSRSSSGALDFDFTLADFLTMEQETMYGYMKQQKDTYTLSVMTVAFFVHLDGKRGIEAMRAYLQALLDGKTAGEAAEVLIEPYHSPLRLQQAFVRAWKGRKVKVSFPKK